MDRESLSWTNGNRTIPRWRAPTADEALQYSPLSSIIPFSSGMPPITLHYIHWHRTAGEPLTSAWSLSLAFTYARVISQHLDILKSFILLINLPKPPLITYRYRPLSLCAPRINLFSIRE